MRSERGQKVPVRKRSLRQEAENTQHPENRQQLLDIAALYDRLAKLWNGSYNQTDLPSNDI